eukprot:TRINITY_DN11036_c0_g1_i1.p1 TRINITY_DN11036_c0_g1~~TRINITY_DN11036_c0_g1_i1.p1  ORF type:complete len:137 (+),score=12.53 TRINITY_DN11036_c0_g1_i1:63-473(+)
MSLSSEMSVTLRLPFKQRPGRQATRLTAVAQNGGFGILPNHMDMVTALVPSVLTLVLTDGSEVIFGLDEGLLVKKGHHVSVSTRRGVAGDDLVSLQDRVQDSFVQMDEDERIARAALSRLEANMVRRFAELRKPPL